MLEAKPSYCPASRVLLDSYVRGCAAMVYAGVAGQWSPLAPPCATLCRRCPTSCVATVYVYLGKPLNLQVCITTSPPALTRTTLHDTSSTFRPEP